ncbi:MAG TPA: hypothetical protein VFM82_02570 [Flavobacteriaceae bacterium]|nr:hypothetical protein [Flavobacteriaceae bacterium]
MQNKISTKTKLRSLLTGSIVAIIIAMSPFIFYSYKGFPTTRTWETFLFNYESNYYESVYVTAWTLMSKFVPFLLMLLWFWTCKHWWRHAIVVPIIMYAFQIFNVLNDDLKYFDVMEIWYIFPMIMVIVPFIYLIRAKLFSEIHGEDLEEFERQIGTKRNIFQQIGDLFR